MKESIGTWKNILAEKAAPRYSSNIQLYSGLRPLFVSALPLIHKYLVWIKPLTFIIIFWRIRFFISSVPSQAQELPHSEWHMFYVKLREEAAGRRNKIAELSLYMRPAASSHLPHVHCHPEGVNPSLRGLTTEGSLVVLQQRGGRLCRPSSSAVGRLRRPKAEALAKDWGVSSLIACFVRHSLRRWRSRSRSPEGVTPGRKVCPGAAGASFIFSVVSKNELLLHRKK